MSYRTHICVHPDWNHVCAGDHVKDHNSRYCLDVWGQDPTSVPLFDLDGETAVA